MADSPGSSVLSDPPSVESEDISSRRSIDLGHDHLAPPSKRRRTGQSSHAVAGFDRETSSQPPEDQDDVELSSDSETSAPPSPSHNTEYAMRDDAQTQCLWRDCEFGEGLNNDELVYHVQNTHCATGGPKKTKYVCEWGECQRKTSNHPSGYALKAHMRSHTKEKPYYCALPECDKAFTRSDALAKHMRTVHEPEPPRGSVGQTMETTTASGRKGIKLKITNGTGAANKHGAAPPDPAQMGPTHDEDGNPVDPSPALDNIAYLPAHHPITFQPGFMINYPPDIRFTPWESAIPADQLMRLLRRQLHWAEQEGKDLQRENEELEKLRREEWTLKEILLEGSLEEELSRGKRRGLLRRVDRRARKTMEHDVKSARRYQWTGGPPAWRLENGAVEDTLMEDVESPQLRRPKRSILAEQSPSPPPTGKSGGFDGDADPYDNYLAGRMAEYEERERMRSMQNTPLKGKEEQQAAEADAVGALIGLSGQ